MHRQENLKSFPRMKTLKKRYSAKVDDAIMEFGTKRRSIKMGQCVKRRTKDFRECDVTFTKAHQFLKKVDVVSHSKPKVGKRCKIISSEVDETQITSNYSSHPFPKPYQVSVESNECSVASCSSNYSPKYTTRYSQKSSRDGADSFLDDAESFCPSIYERKYVTSCDNSNLEDAVHKLELHAYKMTLQALYVSGPLSWEQESLLTNLRISLHISNEEHLFQLRQLLSPQVL
ncbi:hypothetical protein GIB67_027108 [Kingdonia uniflora]|uniref:ENT domain-containing protein n=1 Tax=Kingdonia uniflora TaxID=39325 RepID=A0A7J7P267_9MAGN|nr:hypothetical protein GIB67_027108 [Kingdonia uniflora]